MVINCTNLFSLTKNFIVSSDGYQLNNFTNILNPLIFVLGGFGYGEHDGDIIF
jgi:hypothetical protein